MEAVIRAGLLRLGGSMLGELLAADRGYRGPQVPCGQGHHAVFTGYRDKSFVEASCKSVIGQRLKQAVMHWTVNGADAIIALRCQQASSTWQEPPCKANSG